MAQGFYGNTAGPSPSYFQAYIEIDPYETSGNSQHIRYKYSVWVTAGSNFYGTSLSRSWGGNVLLYGSGWYGDSGWMDAGWYNSGSTFSASCWCSYYSTSSGTHRSNCSASYTVPTFTTAPNAPTSVTLTKKSDTSHTLSWAFSTSSTKPVTSQERALQTNDGSWAYTTINNGTTKSVSLTTAANSKYYAAVRLKNSAGTSAWTYSNVTYTTPATPSAATAIKTGSNVSLQATVSNIRYPKSYQWQRASNSSFSSGLTTLSGTAAVISDTTSLATPYYRVRCLGQSGTYSGWRTATLSTIPQLYVQIPTGKTIQDVYIRKG